MKTKLQKSTRSLFSIKGEKILFSKITLLVVFVTLFGLTSNFTNAQVIVPAANTNNGSVNDPYGTFWGFERTAMIYTNAQIGTTGNITNVGFYLNAVTAPKDAVNVRIYMKMRTTTFTAGTAYATETTGATLVYGPTTISGASFTANNWMTVALTTPFNYTGDNLEIIVETNATGTGNGDGSTGKQFRYTTQASTQFYQAWNADTTAPTGNGSPSDSRPNVSLTFVSSPCTGTPAPGNTLASTNPVIGGSTTTLSLQNATSGTGVTYQWQSSTTNTGPWNNISGATASTYIATPTAKTWYRCVVTCSGNSGNSSPVEITLISCISNPSSNDNSGITSVTVGSETFAVADVTYYNYTSTVPVLTQGSSVNSSISFATGYTYDSHIWIDYNDDLIFDNTTEKVYTGVSLATNPTTLNTTFSVGGAANIGQHKMRIGTADAGQLTPTPCYSGTYGVTVDLMVNIIASAPCVAPTNQPTALILTPSSTIINGSFTAASPVPDKYLVVRNTTGVAPSPGPVNTTSYTIGSTALGGTNVVVDIDGNTTFSTIPLTSSTTYYFFIYSYNSLCSGGPSYNTTSPLTGNATTGLAYCTVSGTTGTFNDGITTVQFNTINNVTSANAGNEYNDYTGISTTVTQGQFHNLSVYVNTDGNYTQYQRAWFDWNGDGDFDDAGEEYNLGTATNVASGISSLCPLSVLIPVTSVTGAIRMRVSSRYNSYAGPCDTAYDGEIEDYTVIINVGPPCVAPTSQPTILVLTPGGNSISGSFTAASPAVQSYLVVMNTTNVAPTGLIANGTNYTIGSSIGVGNTVVDTDTNTSFIAAGLNNSSTYYFFIYSMNNLCTGGPLYNTGAVVLIGNATTTGTAPTYCTAVTVNPNNTSRYISRVAFIGTLNDTNNTSTFSAGTPGYQDFTGTAKSIQAQGEGVNLIVESIGGRARLIAWIDWNKDGTFASTEIVYGPPTAGISSTFGFIIPSGTVPGDYRIRVRTFNSFYDDLDATNGNPDEYFGYDYNACETFNTGTYNTYTTTRYGEAEDYLFTVIQRCDANISSVTNGQVCNSGTVSLSATGTAGTTHYRWYANITGGAQLTGSPTTGSWTTPSIGTTTTYYVTAWNGNCESLERKPVIAYVNPTPTLTFTPSSPEVCGENSIVALTALGDKQRTNLLFEDFESGGLGSFTNSNNDANSATVTNDTKWTNRASTFIPIGISWKPAISSGLAPNSFAVATSDSRTRPPVTVENSLVSGTLDSTNYLNLTMTLNFYYSRYYPDNTNNTDEYVRIQISQDGGSTWTTLQEFLADTGIGTDFVSLSYNLNTYINQANLKIRVLHRSDASVTGWLPDGVAIDNVRIFGDVPLSTAFNWTGASLPEAFTTADCTIPYTPGTPIVTVYVRPTLAQLASGSYTFTATAALANGCTANQDIVITNKSKIYLGATSDWNNAANWSPSGVPSADDCVVITDNKTALISSAGYQAYAKNTTVKGLGVLNIDPLTFLTNTEWINVEAGGVFNMENSASLIQINNVANTGTISMKRNAVTNSIYDYVYWSTPVAGFSVNNVTPSSVYRYMWSPTTTTGYTSNFGNWAAASGAMTTGRGYIIRGSSGLSTFSGVPNNGDILRSITRSTYTGGPYTGPTSTQVTADDDNWNLLGNPYPSAINADSFLAANSANLYQWIKIWTHGIDPSAGNTDSFYQGFVLNYSTADYITYNASGGTQAGFDGKIGAGQGFFVLMNDANTTSENAIFNNSMRSNTLRNDQFYRTGFEKHRVWLDIISPSNTSVTTLVGYISDATNNLDSEFDAIAEGVKANFELYSIAESKELIIQGRSLPFNQNDEVTLGVAIPQNGIYTIAISNVDGLFENASQAIYIEDKQLGIFHDLRTAPYTFTGIVGRDENRFVLLYNSSRLSQDDITFSNNLTVVSNENVTLYSSNEDINSIEVFDLLGRIVRKYNNIDSKEFMLENLQKNNTTLLLKIKLNNGVIVNKKIIF